MFRQRMGLSAILVVLTVLGTSLAWQMATAQDGQKLREKFDEFDTNNDGKLTATELPSAALFKKLDGDGNGEITLSEAAAAVRAGVLKDTTVPEEVSEVTPPTASASALQDVRQGPKVIKPSEFGVGRMIEDVSFTDLEGKTYKLSDFKDHKALVILMTGTGCPLCQKYAPTLANVEQAYREKNVAFVFVNTNESERLDDLKLDIKTHGFQGPYTRDSQEILSRALDAKMTTEAFVLDSARTLRYRGAVSDQYGFAYALEEPREKYLADAIDAVLAGQSPKIPATTSPGCEIFLTKQRESKPSEITYHNRISRIMQNNCLECHRDGALGPFALENYKQVKDYASMIRYVVEQEVMPPWFAAADHHKEAGVKWANDRALSKQEKHDLVAWIKAGAPEGDPADAPLPREFPKDWMIGTPDLITQIPNPIDVKATGRMPYKHVSITTSFKEDRWVQAVEIQPTDPAVVHHVLVFVQDGSARGAIDERAGFFAAYVPGNSYQVYPEGLAKRLPAGARLVFQLHYTPNGKATTDQTRLAIKFAKEKPEHIIRNIGVANHRIKIPPGAGNHPEKASLKVPSDVKLLAFMPHMHLRGKAVRYDLTLPNGERQSLLDIPRYDFNWQLEYRLANPLEIPQGSNLEVFAWYDNSKNNPANPDPTSTVRWGPQTEDEMLIGYVEYYIPDESIDELESSSDKPRASKMLERLFKRADKNGDGKVTMKEFPREAVFKRLDLNGDEIITLEELIEAAPRLR